jgi:hypothetical protein
MSTPRATIRDPSGRIIEMQATPDFTFDTAFDSFLIVKENGSDNHTLTLVLKLHMNQMSPVSLDLPFLGRLTLPFADWNGTPFAIKTWSAADFAGFRTSFLRQCANWNNKFWLIPPAGFSGLDYKLDGRTVRPNIYCHFFVSVLNSAADAHRTIEIVNLDKRAAARQLGKGESDLNATDFRSDSATYDSLDAKPLPLPFKDQTGRTHRVNRSTIAHEIGHALGLPHTGVSHGASVCLLSVLADSLLPSVTSGASFPALYTGGSNSQACYGSSGPPSLGANVMGYGLQFDATNAQPWLDRIALHTGTRAADWKVSVKHKVPPKLL